jgi:anti-sigma B factor antagonist
MTFEEKTISQIPVFEVTGKVMGGLNSKELRGRLKERISEGSKNIVIDLHGVDWMNSPGMGVLLECVTSIRRQGGDFHFTGLNERVTHYFQVTKLDTVLKIYPSIEAALQSLADSP